MASRSKIAVLMLVCVAAIGWIGAGVLLVKLHHAEAEVRIYPPSKFNQSAYLVQRDPRGHAPDIRVSDDGRWTTIEMPYILTKTNAPSVFVPDALDGAPVNYTMQDNRIVVHNLFKVAMLVLPGGYRVVILRTPTADALDDALHWKQLAGALYLSELQQQTPPGQKLVVPAGARLECRAPTKLVSGGKAPGCATFAVYPPKDYPIPPEYQNNNGA